MGLLDELKKKIASEEDLAKLKVLSLLTSKRIAELEGGEQAEPTEEVEEAPAEEAVEETEEAPVEEAEESVEEAIEEPVQQPKPKAKVPIKPAPKAKAPAPKAKPKFAVGMAVYGPPSVVKFPTKDKNGNIEYNKGDKIGFNAKIVKLEGDKAIIDYTEKARAKALGGNPPTRVRVLLSTIEPVEEEPTAETSEDIPDEGIPDED